MQNAVVSILLIYTVNMAIGEGKIQDNCKLDIGKYAFPPRTANEWTKLPVECVIATRVNIMFRNKLDEDFTRTRRVNNYN